MASLPSWGLSSGATGALGTLYQATAFTGQTMLIAASGPGRTGSGAVTYSAPVSPNPTPVTPTFDPKLEANALYGKPMALSAMGYARIGASPAPIVGPYINGDIVDFIVSFGVPANVEGDRKIYKIWLDNELAWSSVAGGTLPGDGTFAAESFDFIFKPGRLDQTVCSLETEKYPGDEIAYRPQMILQIRNLPWARFMANTGKPVPYVALDIGDVTDGADPADGINLGLALERVAYSPWCGYDSGPFGFESVGITDVVGAILIKDNFTIIQLCQSVTREYRNIDLLVSDMIRMKDRGSNVTPNFIFDRDSIIADDEAVAATRAGATEQRREHELIAIDPDQDYTMVPSLSQIPRNPMIISAAVGKETVTVPLVIDANTRQALATFSQNYEENARRKVALKVRVIGYEIEPGDLFALTGIAEGFDDEVFKCTQTSHGANWMVDIEAEAILRCSIYGDELFPINWEAGTAHNVDLSNVNLTATNTLAGTSGDQGARVISSAQKNTGKYYWEITLTNYVGNDQNSVGFSTPLTTFTTVGGLGQNGAIMNFGGQIWAAGAYTGITFGARATGDVIGIALDLDNRQSWFRIAPSGPWNNSGGANPATNTGGVAVWAGAMLPYCTFGGLPGVAGNIITANFGASAFTGTVPAGFTSGWPMV
jgi:hypothetical protein